MSRRPERYALEQLDQFLSKINEYGRAGVTTTELRKVAGSQTNLVRWVKAMTEDDFIYTAADADGGLRYKKTDEGEEMASDLRTDRALWKIGRYSGKRLRPKGYLLPYIQRLREKLEHRPVDDEAHPEPISQTPPSLDKALDVTLVNSSHSPQ
jgi:hypothetical protein